VGPESRERSVDQVSEEWCRQREEEQEREERGKVGIEGSSTRLDEL